MRCHWVLLLLLMLLWLLLLLLLFLLLLLLTSCITVVTVDHLVDTYSAVVSKFNWAILVLGGEFLDPVYVLRLTTRIEHAQVIVEAGVSILDDHELLPSLRLLLGVQLLLGLLLLG